MKRLIFLTLFVLACLIQPVYPQQAQQPATIEQMETGMALIQDQINYLGRIVGELAEKRLLLSHQLDAIRRRLDQAREAEAVKQAAEDSAKGAGK